MNEKTRFMLALITPAALVLLLFQVVPILTGANASFRDWTLYDPKRSKIVGKIGMAPFPVGPRAQKPTSWNEIWGWAIPKGVPAERKKLAKEMLSAMMSDEAGQIEMWKKTGGPPPNIKLWPKLAAEDKDFAALKHAVFDQTPITHSAYYFAEWPAVHKAYSDMAIAALSGKREDIPKVLAEHADKIHRAATGN